MPTDKQKKRIRDTLVEMNRKFAALLSDWDDLPWEEIDRRRQEIASLKYRIIEDLDYTYYYSLYSIDLWLHTSSVCRFGVANDPKKFIELAKEEKQLLERRIRNAWFPG